MNRLRFFIIYVAILFPNSISAKTIEGFVYDSQDKQAISFVNVCIKGSTIGTITNIEGYYSLIIPESYKDGIISFSFIGYETKEYNICDIIQKHSIALTPKSVPIGEVVINPDSTLFTLLKRAFKNIPQNYGTNPSILTGFYRESLEEKDSLFLYIAESVIESYKTSYKNKEQGQVRVIKSRKNISPDNSDRNGVKFYGGLYIAHNLDVVHKRDGAINPRNFKKYRYEYQGLVPYNNEMVYAFTYSKVDSNITGSFYIDKESLAYVYYDYNNKQGGGSTANINMKRLNSHYVIQYSKADGLWFLKSCIYNSELYNKLTKTNLFIKDDYVTTNIKFDQVKALAYTDQVKYSTIISDIATTYNDSFWKDYNILEKDSLSKKTIQLQFSNTEANDLMTVKNEKRKSGKEFLISLMFKFYYKIGVSYNLLNDDASSIGISYNDIELSKQVSNNNNMGLNSGIGFRLTQRLNFEYNLVLSLNKELNDECYTLGFSYLIPLKNSGRQIFALPHIDYLNGFTGYNIGFLNQAQLSEIGEGGFSKGANVYVGKKHQNLLIGIVLQTNLTNFIHLIGGVNYNYSISSSDKFLIKEDGKLIPKETYKDFNSSIHYYEDDIMKESFSLSLDNLSFSIGIKISL